MPATAPEALGIATSIAFSAIMALNVALPWPDVQALLSLVQIALLTFWMALQCKATNALLGVPDAPAPSMPMLIGNAACGGLALLLAVIAGFGNLRAATRPSAGPSFDQQELDEWGQPVAGPNGPRMPAYQRSPQGPSDSYPSSVQPRSKSSFSSSDTATRQKPSGFSSPERSVPRETTCLNCNGGGISRMPCSMCRGSGRGSSGFACNSCNGRGYPPCGACGGKGKVRGAL